MKLWIGIGVLAVGALALGMLLGTSGDENAATATTGGGAIVAVTVPELSGNAAIGARAFSASCAGCHGANAGGIEGKGPPLVHKFYEPSHHGDMAFVMAAERGVRSHHWRFGDMPPVEGVTRAEVLAIVDYVRALQVANGIE